MVFNRFCNYFHNTAVKLTSLLLSILLLDPFLNNGVIFASFNSDATIPSLSDIVKNIKESSYITQCSVLRTAQRVLHFTSLVDLFNQIPSQLLCEA